MCKPAKQITQLAALSIRSSPGGCAPSASGQVLVELVMVISLIVVIAMLGADVGIVSLASAINDSACRDAARAAAQGNSSATALALAQAAIEPHSADGYYVTKPTIDTSKFVYQDFNGSPPVNTSPYVSVTTTSTVRVPAPLFFYGANFEPDGSLTFTRTYTFPIVKTQLYLQ